MYVCFEAHTRTKTYFVLSLMCLYARDAFRPQQQQLRRHWAKMRLQAVPFRVSGWKFCWCGATGPQQRSGAWK
jgi:hypothetical protein